MVETTLVTPGPHVPSVRGHAGAARGGWLKGGESQLTCLNSFNHDLWQGWWCFYRRHEPQFLDYALDVVAYSLAAAA